MYAGRGRPRIPYEQRKLVLFKTRLRPAEARRMEAIAVRLNLPSASVVRLALHQFIERESGVPVADR